MIGKLPHDDFWKYRENRVVIAKGCNETQTPAIVKHIKNTIKKINVIPI